MEDKKMDRPWHAFYSKNVPPTITYPKITLNELFNRNADRHPNKPHLIFKHVSLSYGTCNTMARALANGLLERGVAKGDRVALMMPNIPQYPIALMACYKMGAIAVPANPLYTVPELITQFKDSGTESVIVLASFADKVIQVVKHGGTSVERVIVVQAPDARVDLDDVESIVDLDALLTRSDDREPDITVKPEDIAMLQYTGGTTGVPKGCVLTHANLVAMLEQTGVCVSVLCPVDQIRTLAAIPLYHVYGMNMNINLNLYAGGTMVLVPQPTPDNILKAIHRHHPTIWAAVPAMVQGILNHPDIGNSGIGSMKAVFCGGAPLAGEVMSRFADLSGIKICEGYGLSETSNILTANPEIQKPGSVGIPWPDVDVRIVDPETGTQDMPPGERGEIIAKGPQIMAGYWNNPEETEKTLRNGWLYTGDIGYMDEDGYLFILDRKKDMLICSGFNVYPREIEEVLYCHPGISEACVIGVLDEKRGQTVKAFVVPKPGLAMTAEALTDYCKERLAPYKVPKIVEFIDQLPRTPVGKPDRKALRLMHDRGG
jgi:long-chain acyl-CoA synthetase